MKAFQETADDQSTNTCRDGAALQEQSVATVQPSTPKGSGTYHTNTGLQVQEENGDQKSRMVPGSKPHKNIGLQLPAVMPESNSHAWSAMFNISSLASALHSDLKDKEEELKRQIREIEELERKEKEAQVQLKEQEKIYEEAQNELKEKEKEITDLTASLNAKTCELQQEKEKQEELKRAEEQLKVDKESVAAESKKLQTLKEEAENARANYMKAARDEREKMSNFLRYVNVHLTEYKRKVEWRNRWTRNIILILLSTTVVLFAVLIHGHVDLHVL